MADAQSWRVLRWLLSDKMDYATTSLVDGFLMVGFHCFNFHTRCCYFISNLVSWQPHVSKRHPCSEVHSLFDKLSPQLRNPPGCYMLSLKATEIKLPQNRKPEQGEGGASKTPERVCLCVPTRLPSR